MSFPGFETAAFAASIVFRTGIFGTAAYFGYKEYARCNNPTMSLGRGRKNDLYIWVNGDRGVQLRGIRSDVIKPHGNWMLQPKVRNYINLADSVDMEEWRRLQTTDILAKTKGTVFVVEGVFGFDHEIEIDCLISRGDA